MTDHLTDIEQEMMFKGNERINDRYLFWLTSLSAVTIYVPMAVYNLSAWFIAPGSIVMTFFVSYIEKMLNYKYPYKPEHLKP